MSSIAVAEESLAMLEGALKYGAYNYRASGVRTTVYIDAMLRHLAKFLNGEDRDPKTGVHHLGSVRAGAGILLDSFMNGNINDDRPPKAPTSEQLDAMENRVKHLKDVFKEYAPKHYTANDVPDNR